MCIASQVIFSCEVLILELYNYIIIFGNEQFKGFCFRRADKVCVVVVVHVFRLCN